ncbi:MAG TPA: sugar transferase, partial [Acidimicrobiales bacterium]|nr:sugar transferase [Acidimicrobiales bacterium]
GRAGRPFVLHKFRTMVADASGRGPAVTRGGDPRVTRVGAFLRRWKLDELPNLLDVLRGEMSLVGPRPEDPRYVAHYTAEQRRVLSVRPGITSPATYRFRHEEALLHDADDLERTYVDAVLPEKLRLDLEYVGHRSLLGDAQVLAETVVAVFRRGRGSRPPGPGSEA